MVRFFPLQGLTLLSLTLFHIFVYFPRIRQLPRLPFKNLLTFVNPYVDAMVAIPFIERMIVILSLINSKSAAKKQEETMMNRPITIFLGCANLTCSYISRAAYVRLCRLSGL